MMAAESLPADHFFPNLRKERPTNSVEDDLAAARQIAAASGS